MAANFLPAEPPRFSRRTALSSLLPQHDTGQAPIAIEITQWHAHGDIGAEVDQAGSGDGAIILLSRHRLRHGGRPSGNRSGEAGMQLRLLEVSLDEHLIILDPVPVQPAEIHELIKSVPMRRPQDGGNRLLEWTRAIRSLRCMKQPGGGKGDVLTAFEKKGSAPAGKTIDTPSGPLPGRGDDKLSPQSRQQDGTATPEEVNSKALRQKLDFDRQGEAGFVLNPEIFSDVVEYGRWIFRSGMDLVDWSVRMPLRGCLKIPSNSIQPIPISSTSWSMHSGSGNIKSCPRSYELKNR